MRSRRQMIMGMRIDNRDPGDFRETGIVPTKKRTPVHGGIILA